MAPSGLYARLCHAFSSFFSPLGKLAGTAIYFANVFSLLFNFFSGRLRSPAGSEANGLIFTKISGLVDRYKGLSFFDFSKDVSMATN